MTNNKDKKDTDHAAEEKEHKESKISDTIRKIISSGSPSEISKELIGTVVSQVLKTKDDIALKATNEMISLIRKIDFVKEFSKFAENHKFKISAEVEIIKKEDSKN